MASFAQTVGVSTVGTVGVTIAIQELEENFDRELQFGNIWLSSLVKASAAATGLALVGSSITSNRPIFADMSNAIGISLLGGSITATVL